MRGSPGGHCEGVHASCGPTSVDWLVRVAVRVWCPLQGVQHTCGRCNGIHDGMGCSAGLCDGSMLSLWAGVLTVYVFSVPSLAIMEV